MKRIFCLLLACCALVFAGCGGGNDGAGGLNGAVTVTGTQVASDFSSTVSFTISYTNPLRTDLIGVPINFTVTLDGVVIDHVATNFNNSGVLIVSYDIPKAAFERSVRCAANSDNLVGSTTIKVAAFDELNVTPATQEFAATDLVGATKNYTISGGSGNYTVESSSDTSVTATLSGKTVIATRQTEGSATVIITVTDVDTGNSIAVQATVIAIPPPAEAP